MRKILIVFMLVSLTKAVYAQEQFPAFTTEALITSDTTKVSKKGEYQLLIYGAIGCSYSRYLIDNLKAFDDCEQLEIIILLNDTKDAILKAYPELIKKYRVYANDMLNYQLTKNNDITPQTLLFKNDKQLLHIKGVKKNMFVKINDEVNCRD